MAYIYSISLGPYIIILYPNKFTMPGTHTISLFPFLLYVRVTMSVLAWVKGQITNFNNDKNYILIL